MEQTRGGVQLRSAFLSSSLSKTAAFFCIEISRKRTAFLCIEISCEKGQQFPTKKNLHFSHPLSSLRGVLLINTHTRTHKSARFCRQRVLLSLCVSVSHLKVFSSFSSQK